MGVEKRQKGLDRLWLAVIVGVAMAAREKINCTPYAYRRIKALAKPLRLKLYAVPDLLLRGWDLLSPEQRAQAHQIDLSVDTNGADTGQSDDEPRQKPASTSRNRSAA